MVPDMHTAEQKKLLYQVHMKRTKINHNRRTAIFVTFKTPEEREAPTLSGPLERANLIQSV
jgi:hypothetical protein